MWTALGKIGQLWAQLDSFGQNWTALGKTGQLFENVDTALGKIGQNLSKLGNFLKMCTALGKTGQLCTVYVTNYSYAALGSFQKL
jgi:hypothetical protein